MHKAISCVQTNIQTGFRRFPDPRHQPLMKSWRCELTALSHMFNLYFIACNDTIHVHQPSFPNQSLSANPDLILHPPISSPLLEPGIDLADPHSITRLHVDYLGREEILLATCDDGDVVGYRIPEIHRAIKNRDHFELETGTDLEDHIRVLLHLNVGASAWGLAVHREARLIAISSNTHRVTVLAYALSRPSDYSDDARSVDSFSLSDEAEDDFPHPRWRDHCIVLQATTNIPAVNFDNSGDPTGRWLFSSSIDGTCNLWDLYAPQKPARIIEVGHCVSVEDQTAIPGPCRCPNRSSVPHAAWAAMFIDPRFCHQAESLVEACGAGVGPEGPTKIAPCFWDITETKHRFSLRRNVPIRYSDSQSLGHDNDVGTASSDEMSLSDEDQMEEDDDPASHDSEQMSITSDEESDIIQSGDQDNGQAQGPSQLDTPAQAVSLASPQGQSLFIPEIPPAVHSSPTIWLSDEEEDSEDSPLSEADDGDDLIQLIQAAETSPLFPPPAPEPVRASTKWPYCKVIPSEAAIDLPQKPKPCVIVTKEEIYLFQRPFDSVGELTDPILTMRNPLFPPTDELRGGVYPTPSFHRHCFATQIPELGIFIVASPAGRVGIFSLTKATTSSEGGQSVLYGYRLDHLLPSVKTEGAEIIGEVWGRRLMGVAVGPVQGMLDQSEDEDGNEVREKEPGMRRGARRWRLIMYYHDHTVYSYELGRFAQEEGMGLGDLVV